MESQDLQVRLETMHSSISENQFMIHILNNLTSDYELQLAMIEKKVSNSERALTAEEIRGELSLRFERLNISKAEGDVFEEHEMIGHCGTDRLKKIATVHSLKLKGELKVCEDCSVAKARQKNV
jgi:hypothetical protein